VSPETVQVLSPVDRPALDLVESGSARAVVWPGVGATLRAMHLLTLPSGGSTRPLRHEGEAVYYVVAGSGSVHDGERGEDADLRVGSMIHVEPGTSYRLTAGDDGLEVVGGPGPADTTLYPEGA
jgi:mannose-6-phosphate isomerase-like protein (cupin superfamily)